MNNYTKFTINATSNFESTVSDNDTGCPTIISSKDLSIDLLSFAKNQSTKYVGIKAFGQIDFEFDIQ